MSSINGRYEVIRVLGKGSLGIVYLCRHRELADAYVALKLLYPEIANNPVAGVRLQNEIIASYGVSHPNVVQAYEYFKDGDTIGFTMEYVDGGDLTSRIDASPQTEIAEVVRLLSELSLGLIAIHEAGIVHRDLKPENILLTSQGAVKITDFGMARNYNLLKPAEHGGVVGSIDYVSPEYLEHGQADFRSDIFALGVTAYELITGQTPFEGKSAIEKITKRLQEDPKSPATIRSECPSMLGELVLKCLARDPDRRYQTVEEFKKDLAHCAEIPQLH